MGKVEKMQMAFERTGDLSKVWFNECSKQIPSRKLEKHVIKSNFCHFQDKGCCWQKVAVLSLRQICQLGNLSWCDRICFSKIAFKIVTDLKSDLQSIIQLRWAEMRWKSKSGKECYIKTVKNSKKQNAPCLHGISQVSSYNPKPCMFMSSGDLKLAIGESKTGQQQIQSLRYQNDLPSFF